MNLEDFELNIQKLDLESYDLNAPASEVDFEIFSQRTGCQLPSKVKCFYENFNGLVIKEKEFSLYPINALTKIEDSPLIEFCKIQDVSICFDTSKLNSAEQWDIIEPEEKYRITLTMASFWSNKIWKWFNKSGEFWTKEFF